MTEPAPDPEVDPDVVEQYEGARHAFMDLLMRPHELRAARAACYSNGKIVVPQKKLEVDWITARHFNDASFNFLVDKLENADLLEPLEWGVGIVAFASFVAPETGGFDTPVELREAVANLKAGRGWTGTGDERREIQREAIDLDLVVFPLPLFTETDGPIVYSNVLCVAIEL